MSARDSGPAVEDPVSVLVISADASVSAFFVALLGREGLAADAALVDDAAARTTAADPPYALVLVDATDEPVRSIRALADPPRARTPIVVLGPAGGGDDDEPAAMAAGASAWVRRPIDDSQLISVLRRTVSG